ncbi:hypothetical protein [Streptomyces sp. NPDC091383]|uniref:hypothetical protein n=1 Tax=Streptomyces sp. NPDC091383 TaxID=3365996 RepID=UPI003804B6E3
MAQTVGFLLAAPRSRPRRRGALRHRSSTAPPAALVAALHVRAVAGVRAGHDPE